MIFKIFRPKYIFILPALLLLLAFRSSAQQCPQWGISAVAEPSVCAASGKITLSFTGTGAGNVSDMLFSLNPLVSGGYSVAPNTSSLFENVPAGSYRATAKGICNNEVVSATVDVVVPGNYVPFKGAIAQYRPALHACNTGQAYVTMANGRLPYRIDIIGKPPSYTGRTSFTATHDIYIDSLQPGTYTVSITDACGAGASIQALIIDELSLIPATDLYSYRPSEVPGTCNKMVIRGPRANPSSPFNTYMQTSGVMTYSVSYNGMPKTPYKDLGSRDTITLPEGQTFKDTYDKTFTYYIRTPCGEEVVYNRQESTFYLWDYFTLNCATDFDESYYLDTTHATCYPVYVSLTNKTTGASRYDTIKMRTGPRTMTHLPFGTYRLKAVSADGAIGRDQDIVVNGPTESPYFIVKMDYAGDMGNDRAAQFVIYKSAGYITPGTNISLISPSNIPYSFTFPNNFRDQGWVVNQTQTTPAGFFYPGSYTFRVTDNCGSYDLPVTVTEKDVYHYNLTYTEEQTCTGLKIKPTGTSVYNDKQQPVYFRITYGPRGNVGYDGSIITRGDSLLLPIEGAYRIAMASDPTYVGDWGGPNAKEINFTYKPLIIDVNNSLGWICPGAPDNSGSIAAVAIGGSKAATGVYTYRLAADGKGATGPYWATNTTGKFSTATSGGAYTLMKDENYDVRVEDECGAAAVQRLKIIDFETAELATASKLEYCIGERIEFKIINLPTTAITYRWSGPDNFSSTLQNPVVSPVTSASGGTYHVMINSDICMNPIHAQVDIALVPYTLTCYSAVADTSVDPYTYGLLGNWRPQRSYVYFNERTEASTGQSAYPRTSGTIRDFVSFWKKGTSKGWQAQYDTTRWAWNSASTLFNKKGFELENTDALGRFNAVIYGFDDALTTAVSQNARYRETAYEGFEDYYFTGATCDTACSGERSFDFSSYKANLDSTQQHTGKYSLRIAAGQSAGISAAVGPNNADVFNLSFNRNANSCVTGGQVLGSIRTNKDAILPVYSPINGKSVVISAWVKEEKDCKGLTYTGNRMRISVKRAATSTVVMATPKGGIIDGWQRYEQTIDIPADAVELSISMEATGSSSVYFDDLRIHPYNANMKSFVYSPADLRLMAELDENNYATFYEYDDDGTLIRLKKETENGIKMIRETRSALLKD
jgi:hypothetical protein